MGGCFSSSKALDENNKIEYNFGTTHVYNIDEFFTNVRDTLKEIEEIRAGIEDNRASLIQQTLAQYLQTPSFEEAIKIMLWCISANNSGDIKSCNPKAESNPPYFSISLHNMRYETAKLWTYFEDYLKNVSEGPNRIITLTNKFLDYVDEAPTLLDRAGEESTRSGQQSVKKAQTVVTTTKNANIIKLQVDKVKRVNELVEDAKKEMDKIVAHIKDQLTSCDQVGKKAFEDNKFTPKEIFDDFHQGPKKSPEQIGQMKQEKR